MIFLITVIYEETTFRPPSLPFTLFPRMDIHKANPYNKTSAFTFYHNYSLNPDFSLMSYATSLLVFEISIFLYAFVLFYRVGGETINMSHSDLIQLRRSKMRSYYEAVLIEMSSNCNSNTSTDDNDDEYVTERESNLCGGKNKVFSFCVWTSLFIVNIALIWLGFYKHAWIMILAGMYGIYETTWEFAKVYPNWFERKVILLSYCLILGTNSLMNFSTDHLMFKLYPLTKNSYYFYVLIHYLLKSTAMSMLVFVANLD
jgi:hypothetical protein